MTKNEYVLDNLLKQKAILEAAEEVDQEAIDVIDDQISLFEDRIAKEVRKGTVKKKK